MAFPTGWPPRPASGLRSIRFYVSGTATANFDDSAYLFSQGTGANTYTPLPYVAPGSTAPVEVGNLSAGGTPWGGGQDPHDNQPVASPTPMIFSQGVRICNDSMVALEFSFDGTNVHGKLLANESAMYFARYESGIAVRGAGAAFRIEAW